jgi:hypothetical protein
MTASTVVESTRAKLLALYFSSNLIGFLNIKKKKHNSNM